MKIYVIGGRAKSGKNTFGKYLREELKNYGYKPCVMHITEPLYSYAKNYFDWNENSDEKPREFLQKMGIEIIQKKLHKNLFLIDRLCEDIEILSNFFDTFIITDARLITEFIELKKRFPSVTTIHLSRENYDDGLSEEEKMHITEIEVELYDQFDYNILNVGLKALKEDAKKIIKKEEEII